MNLLLDTHTFLWWNSSPTKLSAKALAACNDSANTMYLSVVSAWEIQIKTNIGKMKLNPSLEVMINKNRIDNNLAILPVELSHVLALTGIPNHHKDPFDRLLIAQAQVEGAHFVTADPQIHRYSIPIIW